MRRSARLLAASAILAASAAAGVASAPVAAAEETVTSGAWRGSTVARVPCEGLMACGLVKRADEWGSYQITVDITVTGPATPGCTVSHNATVLPAQDAAFVTSGHRAVAFDLGATCNGTYQLTADARAVSTMGHRDSLVLERQVAVSMPAPEVTGVRAQAADSGRAVTVRWDDMRVSAPDLAGYTVERKVADGSFEALAAPGADQQSFTDSDLPVEAGTATYRVRSRRPAPDGEKVSAQSSAEPVAFSAGDPAEEDPDDSGSGSGDGGSGGDDAGPGEPADGAGGEVTGGGDAAPGDGSSTGSGRRPGRRVAPPRVGIDGTFQPPALGPISPDARVGSTTSTTVDTGFDEDLPYNPVDGPLEAEPPDDELAAFFTEDSPGRGMAIPIATALVLAVWAFHLRVLARAAKPPA